MLVLDDSDEALLAGEAGPAGALAMRMVAAVAEAMRAPSLLDILHPGLTGGPPERARPARELMEAYVELGARPTFTCAPYQLEVARPGLGEHVAWAESNAIVFANSVLGARTNRYGDFCDIAC